MINSFITIANKNILFAFLFYKPLNLLTGHRIHETGNVKFVVCLLILLHFIALLFSCAYSRQFYCINFAGVLQLPPFTSKGQHL